MTADALHSAALVSLLVFTAARPAVRRQHQEASTAAGAARGSSSLSSQLGEQSGGVLTFLIQQYRIVANSRKELSLLVVT
jgi:hypothetical protein